MWGAKQRMPTCPPWAAYRTGGIISLMRRGVTACCDTIIHDAEGVVKTEYFTKKSVRFCENKRFFEKRKNFLKPLDKARPMCYNTCVKQADFRSHHATGVRMVHTDPSYY